MTAMTALSTPGRKELVLVPKPVLVRLPLLTIDTWLEDVLAEAPAERSPIPRRDRSPVTRAGYGRGRPNRNRTAFDPDDARYGVGPVGVLLEAGAIDVELAS